MTRTQMHARIAETQAQHLPPLTWADVFSPVDGQPPPSVDDQAKMNDYFKIFIEWPKDADGHAICIGCQKRVQGGLMGALLGGAPDSTTFEYGIAHGECYCRKCGWPARANHYDIGGKGEDALITRMTLTLLYHPDGLTPVVEEPEAAQAS